MSRLTKTIRNAVRKGRASLPLVVAGAAFLLSPMLRHGWLAIVGIVLYGTSALFILAWVRHEAYVKGYAHGVRDSAATVKSELAKFRHLVQRPARRRRSDNRCRPPK